MIAEIDIVHGWGDDSTPLAVCTHGWLLTELEFDETQPATVTDTIDGNANMEPELSANAQLYPALAENADLLVEYALDGDLLTVLVGAPQLPTTLSTEARI